MSDHDSETEEVADLSNPDVSTKYNTAAEIVNKALKAVLVACVVDADVVTLCEMGDKIMEEETGKVYNKKVKDRKVEKGIAFPTCVSVNELVGHFSPLKGESTALKAGDLVKVDLACHIDGFIAAAAHTIVVGEEKTEGRKADVIHAAWNAAEAALRLVQAGRKNFETTEALAKIAAEFECKPVIGVKSHQLKKHVIDGEKCIMNVENPDEKREVHEFEMNEVYCVDIVISTGEGKVKESEIRSTVFKRNLANSYILKTQKARQFISEVSKRFPALPFSLRAIEDEQVARIGVSESRRHELLEEYPVMREKEKEFVAQFKFTVLLLPSGTKKIAGLPFTDTATIVSKHEIKDEALKTLLSSSANPKKANKKKKVKDGEKKEEE